MKHRSTNYFLGGALVVMALLPAWGAAAAETPPPPSSLNLINTVTGNPLDLGDSLPTGRDTPAVKEFLASGRNPYTEVKQCLPPAKSLFLTACSGCHGQTGEGKVGPSLQKKTAYWTYETNKTDQGLFATIFGGANGMMGPHNQDLSLDQILLVMAWIRHLYQGPVDKADWLNDAQKKAFHPYEESADKIPTVNQTSCSLTAK